MGDEFKIVKLVDPPVVINITIKPRGEYDNATDYFLGDIVQYQGASYIALGNTTGNLPTDTNFWQLIVDPPIKDAFETVSKNLKSWDSTLTYTGSSLTSIAYTDGVSTITKTLNYTSNKLTSVVLSGDTPLGIDLTKTLTYTGNKLASTTYS